MKLSQESIYAFLWEEIERIAFKPNSSRDKKSWLICYIKSLNSFWGLGDFPVNTQTWMQDGKIQNTGVKLEYQYRIEDLEKFSVTLWDQSKKIRWIHDVDGKNYFGFPRQIFPTKSNPKNPIIDGFTEQHLTNVLESLMFHPKVHQHIESPIDEHEIRIGGGIDNPYLYLFHLRYQLCRNTEQRQKEKERLKSLFYKRIKRKEKTVPAGVLFGVR